MGNFKWFCLISLLFLSTFQQISAVLEEDGTAGVEKPKVDDEDGPPKTASSDDVVGDDDVRPPPPSASEDGPEPGNAERAEQDEEKVGGFGGNDGAAAANDDDDGMRPREEPSADNADETAKSRDFGEGSPSENLGADVPEEGPAPSEDREESVDREGAASENFGDLGEKAAPEDREEANFGGDEARNAEPREFGEGPAEPAQNDGDFGSEPPRAEVEREEVGERQVEPEAMPEVPVAAPLGHPVESPHGHGHETPVKPHVESPKPHSAKNSAPPSPAKHEKPLSPAGSAHPSPKPGTSASPSGSPASAAKAAKLKADAAALEKAVEQFQNKAVELHLPANVQAKVQKDAKHLEADAVKSGNAKSAVVKKDETALDKDFNAQHLSPKVKTQFKAEEDHLVAAAVNLEKDLEAEVPNKEQKAMRNLVADVIQSGDKSPKVKAEEKKVLGSIHSPQDKEAVVATLHAIGNPPSPGHADHAAAGAGNAAADLAKLGQELTKVERDVNGLPVKPDEKQALTNQAHVVIVDEMAGSPNAKKELDAVVAKVAHEPKVPAKQKNQTKTDLKAAAVEAAKVGAESPDLRKDLQKLHATLEADSKKAEVKKTEAAVAGDVVHAIENPKDNTVAQKVAKEIKADAPHLAAKQQNMVMGLLSDIFNKIRHPFGGPAKGAAAAAPKSGKPKAGTAGSHHGGDSPKKAGGNKASLVHVPSRRHGVPAA